MEKELERETWTYAGLREVAGGRLGHAWVPDLEGSVLLFAAKRRRYSVGARYEVRISRPGGDGLMMHGEPCFLEAGNPDPKWVVASMSAESVIEGRRAERRAKKEGGLDDVTLSDLREVMRKQLPSQRRGTLAAVLEYLGTRTQA
jgi:hypothetical protein